MELKNKTALITGGSSGLGFETAKLLIKKGCNVIILGKNPKKVKAAAKKINSPKLSTVICDLTDCKQIEKVARNIKSLDILINNAGVIMYSLLEKHTPEKIAEIVNVNLLGTIYMTRAILPKMKRVNSGTVLNVITASALKGRAEETVYIASKWGVRGFTEALKDELEKANSKIRVLGFYPGGMNTQLFAKAGLDKDTSSFMDPAEIAKIIVFMLERPETIKIDQVVVNRNKNI